MKTYINLFVLVSISLTTLLLSSLVGCRRHTEDEVEPVVLIQAIPANGSTIQKDATIIAIFDSTPTGLNVTGGKFYTLRGRERDDSGSVYTRHVEPRPHMGRRDDSAYLYR